jgi:Domain of unknown function (DUF4160)
MLSIVHSRNKIGRPVDTVALPRHDAAERIAGASLSGVPSILRVAGYRFFVFSNEREEPAHIHVEQADRYSIVSGEVE